MTWPLGFVDGQDKGSILDGEKDMSFLDMSIYPLKNQPKNVIPFERRTLLKKLPF